MVFTLPPPDCRKLSCIILPHRTPLLNREVYIENLLSCVVLYDSSQQLDVVVPFSSELRDTYASLSTRYYSKRTTLSNFIRFATSSVEKYSTSRCDTAVISRSFRPYNSMVLQQIVGSGKTVV